MSTPQEQKRKSLPQRIAASIRREPLFPDEERLRARAVVSNLILHIHPPKVAKRTLKFNYTFGLGGLLILLFSVLSVTGVLLLFVYTPSPDAAYESMVALQTEINFGNLIRNLHHWSGNAMIVVAVLHLMRVFFTGGFTAPREFNWIMGITLLLLIVGANFTGYLLPWDQLAYWAITVGTSLLNYIPIIGDKIANLLLGGPEVGAATLTNFYGLHIAVIPLAIFAVVSFHIWRVRKDTLTVPRKANEEPEKRTEKVTTIPNLVNIELVFALVMLAALFTWAVFINAPLEEAANPAHSPNPAKAAWYFMGFQELLLHFHPVFGAIVIPSLGLVAMFLLPYLDKDMDAAGIWFRSTEGLILAIFNAVGAVGLTTIYVLLDEFFLDLPGWLPFLPSIISNGWVPLAAILLALMLYMDVLKNLKFNKCEIYQAIFTLLFFSFITLTVIGIFFRGEGMALILPWS
ncbi:MAG TPA: cytochrome b N-terminal domain-containing protein [Anaerolineales bacterium]|nr:cytochrome b N-terminal domain-containing protein [Anaerolineales bacterium]